MKQIVNVFFKETRTTESYTYDRRFPYRTLFRSPGGEAGFASERRRPPSVRRLPAAAAVHSCSCVAAPYDAPVATSPATGGSQGVNASGCDQTSKIGRAHV